MANLLLLFLLGLSSHSLAGDVPVLMWSPERPLSDLPQAVSTGPVSESGFADQYLAPLLDTKGQIIVAFLQDKLHINDISKYADVYNPSSDGGAFKNIKGFLDEHFSLELPGVSGSVPAVEGLRGKRPVHEVSSLQQLSGLPLQEGALLIVRLAPVATAPNEERAIADNDQLVGSVIHHLQKRGLHYTALYTAHTSQSAGEETRRGRHLLAEDLDVDASGLFVNSSYGNGSVYTYLTAVSYCLYTRPDDVNWVDDGRCDVAFFKADLTNKVDTTGTTATALNNTVVLTLKLNDVKSNSTADLPVNITAVMVFTSLFDRWTLNFTTVTVDSKNDSLSTKGAVALTSRRYQYDTVVSALYSFHCSAMDFYSKNANSSLVVRRFTLGGLQVQPFNTGPHYGFSGSQDCVGWFTTAIWMGILPVAINILVLLFGMYMIASLSTNDRFDDPKGKTLTINAQE